MTKTKFKICGLTRQEDVAASVAAGADYLGFILYPKSPRFVSAQIAKKLIQSVPANIKKVGVFVNEKTEEIIRLMTYCGFDIAQLHGEESEAEALKVGKGKVWKAMRLASRADIEKAAAYPAAAILADSINCDTRGGTGQICDWSIAAQAAKRFKLVLAGGINFDNCVEAVRVVNPFALDLCSGVESAPGIKDHKKISDFSKRLGSLYE